MTPEALRAKMQELMLERATRPDPTALELARTTIGRYCDDRVSDEDISASAGADLAGPYAFRLLPGLLAIERLLAEKPDDDTFWWLCEAAGDSVSHDEAFDRVASFASRLREQVDKHRSKLANDARELEALAASSADPAVKLLSERRAQEIHAVLSR